MRHGRLGEPLDKEKNNIKLGHICMKKMYGKCIFKKHYLDTTRHYYGPVVFLLEEVGNNKDYARVPLNFPFFSSPSPDRPLHWELVKSSFKVVKVVG